MVETIDHSKGENATKRATTLNFKGTILGYATTLTLTVDPAKVQNFKTKIGIIGNQKKITIVLKKSEQQTLDRDEDE